VLLLVCQPLLAQAPVYKAGTVFIPSDQPSLDSLVPKTFYKPHGAAYSAGVWITSNERTGCAGITIFSAANNNVISTLNIDEPNVAYASGEEATASPCVGTLLPPAPEPPEGTTEGTGTETEVQFADDVRMNPTVCLPVRLARPRVVASLNGKNGRLLDENHMCAPLGAESHPRHPHGVEIDATRKIAYQVVEHSGLKWAGRKNFGVATTTDEESGLLLAYDISDPAKPKMIDGWLLGHAAEEAAINQTNGKVFVGNHEDSPGVYPSIFVSVIDPSAGNPYGFVDTGYFNAIQGVEWDSALNVVFGTTHVGEKMFAIDGNCVPTENPKGVLPPPPPPGYTLPADSTNMKTGWNCVKYWVDLRPAFVQALPDVAGTLLQSGIVLHMHDLTVNSATHRAYQSLHAIHDAEHTGLPEQEPADETAEIHGNARYVVEVDAAPGFAIDPNTKQAQALVSVIDLSHGYDILNFPNVDDIIETEGVQALENSFVHAHFLTVDSARNMLFVSGEHTGNLGIVDMEKRTLNQVIPISIGIPDCTLPAEPGQPPEIEEPHVHGVTLGSDGLVYVSDEGEHCFYESVTIVNPSY
jgi:hypothetical protein